MSKATVVHVRSASPEAVYVGRGPDPRTGRRMSGALYHNPFSLSDYPLDEVARRFFAHVRARPWLVERARRELAGKELACWCEQPVLAEQGDLFGGAS